MILVKKYTFLYIIITLLIHSHTFSKTKKHKTSNSHSKSYHGGGLCDIDPSSINDTINSKINSFYKSLLQNNNNFVKHNFISENPIANYAQNSSYWAAGEIKTLFIDESAINTIVITAGGDTIQEGDNPSRNNITCGINNGKNSYGGSNCLNIICGAKNTLHSGWNYSQLSGAYSSLLLSGFNNIIENGGNGDYSGISSQLFISGGSNSIYNGYNSSNTKIDGGGACSTIISAGLGIEIYNPYEKNIIIATGKGSFSNNTLITPETYETSFNQSISLSAGETDNQTKGFIILNPLSLPLHEDLESDHVLCLKSNDGRIIKMPLNEITQYTSELGTYTFDNIIIGGSFTSQVKIKGLYDIIIGDPQYLTDNITITSKELCNITTEGDFSLSSGTNSDYSLCKIYTNSPVGRQKNINIEASNHINIIADYNNGGTGDIYLKSFSLLNKTGNLSIDTNGLLTVTTPFDITKATSLATNTTGDITIGGSSYNTTIKAKSHNISAETTNITSTGPCNIITEGKFTLLTGKAITDSICKIYTDDPIPIYGGRGFGTLNIEASDHIKITADYNNGGTGNIYLKSYSLKNKTGNLSIDTNGLLTVTTPFDITKATSIATNTTGDITIGGSSYNTTINAKGHNIQLDVGTTGINGSIILKGIDNSGTAASNLQIDANGKITKSTSSKRYKENIQPMMIDETAIINLKPVFFNFIGSPNYTTTGLIAEDLIGTPFEYAIIYNNENQPEGIDYNSIFIYLLAAYKKTTAQYNEKIILLEEICNNLNQRLLLLENK
jgi:hypothetical protein